jgi:hypothetical protein
MQIGKKIKLRNMKKIIYLLSLALIITSCDDFQPATFDGGQTFVYFPSTSVNLEVVIDATGTASVQINTTTLSDSDRTVSLGLLPESTADPENYEIPSFDVVIPAGEYFGEFIINGIDNSVETTPELLFFNISSADGAQVSNDILEVSVRQICPIAEGDFTGPYQLEQLTPIHADNGVLSFETQVLDLVVNGGPTERSFTAVWIEGLGIGQGPATVPFDLSCNEVLITSNSIGTSLTCGDGGITLGVPAQNGVYDTADDSVFTLWLAEYVVDGGCGVSPPLQTEFQFTKQ